MRSRVAPVDMMGRPFVRSAARACAVVMIAIAIGAPARAQGTGTGVLLRKKAKKPPPNDPRKGPRLVYSRGPAACLSESDFRDEVAIILDGVDHWDATSLEVVDVTFG